MIAIHRCPHCQHIDLHHDKGECMMGRCGCRLNTATVRQSGAPSEAIPTWDFITGDLIQTFTPPGQKFQGINPTCGCDECKQVAAR